MSKIINLTKSNNTQAGDVRERFLARGPELVDLACDLAAGKMQDYEGNVEMLIVLAKKMIPVIKLDDDSVTLPNITDIASPQQRIEKLLDMAAAGECSIATADSLIDILIRQVDVQDAGEIRKALEKNCGQGVNLLSAVKLQKHGLHLVNYYTLRYTLRVELVDTIR